MQQISKLVWPIYDPRQWGLGQVLCYNEYSLLAVTSNLVLIGNYEVAKECKEYYTIHTYQHIIFLPLHRIHQSGTEHSGSKAVIIIV